MNSTLNLAIEQVARNLSVNKKLVENVYKSYWKFIKNHVASYSLRGMSQEEFESIDTNFNIPYIGKLYIKKDKLERYNNQLKYYQNVKSKKNKTNRVSGTSN